MSMTVLVLPKRHRNRNRYQHQYYPNRKPRGLPILISLFIMATLTLSYLIRHTQASTITTTTPSSDHEVSKSNPQSNLNHRHRHSNHKNTHQDDSHALNYQNNPKSHTITNGNQAQTSHNSITTMQTILRSYQKEKDDSSYESNDTQLTTVPEDDTALANVRHQRSRKLKKRDFYPICKGVYDKSIYARLDRICEDCFNLFHEPELHLLCRSKCFTTKYFKGCVETLLLTEEMKKFTEMIEFLGGK